jgi:hypothetical protein
MAPTGVAGASEATGSVEEVAALALSASVDEVAGDSVLEAGASDDASDAVSVDDLEVEDEDDVLVDELEVDFLLVELVVGATDNMVLLLSPLCVVCAVSTEVRFALQ